MNGGLDKGVFSRRKGELGERWQTPFRQVERIAGGKVGGGEEILRAKGICACLHQRGKLAGSEDRVEKVFRESTARRVMMDVKRRIGCERVPVKLPLILGIFGIEILERRLRREAIHVVTLQGVTPKGRRAEGMFSFGLGVDTDSKVFRKAYKLILLGRKYFYNEAVLTPAFLFLLYVSS